ncbi:NADPH-dependent F420 reductase [Oryzobacter terrae]|uniref:NADPH-dependent F420 reductase n=1 Tax=Oryzobacter terrae TaxID=1620385 RepID=UPI00366BAC8F
MATISIIGTGNMGQAIAALAGRGGHTVQLLGQHDADTPLGDVVVLAVPHAAVADVIAARGAHLAGTIVVDITNPVDFETFDGLTVPTDASATAGIAAALPDSRVLKAFNTNFASTLASGTVGDLTTTVLIAGDDADAKAVLAGIVTSGGLKAVDAGSLRRARELEAVGFLQISLAAAEKIAWTGGFGVAA